jgi:hypothetical protein
MTGKTHSEKEGGYERRTADMRMTGEGCDIIVQTESIQQRDETEQVEVSQGDTARSKQIRCETKNRGIERPLGPAGRGREAGRTYRASQAYPWQVESCVLPCSYGYRPCLRRTG